MRAWLGTLGISKTRTIDLRDVMSTGELFLGTLRILRAELQTATPRSHLITRRMSAAVIASSLVLPAVVPIFEAFSVHSTGLFLIGLFLLTGFWTPFYVLVCRFREEEVAASLHCTAPHPRALCRPSASATKPRSIAFIARNSSRERSANGL